MPGTLSPPQPLQCHAPGGGPSPGVTRTRGVRSLPVGGRGERGCCGGCGGLSLGARCPRCSGTAGHVFGVFTEGFSLGGCPRGEAAPGPSKVPPPRSSIPAQPRGEERSSGEEPSQIRDGPYRDKKVGRGKKGSQLPVGK